MTRPEPAVTRATTDHSADQRDYAWCVAHRACSCPFASIAPHARAMCRYADDQTDVEETATDATR